MRFSVIIPTYNRKDMLTLCITKLVQSNFTDYEIIIVDDGGSDNSKVCLEVDHRIRYFWIENVGPGAARNFGAKHASGDYFVFLDSDDFLMPYALEYFNEVILNNPTTKYSISRCYRIDREVAINVLHTEKRALTTKMYRNLMHASIEDISLLGLANGGHGFIERSEFISSGGYCEKKINGEDAFVMIRNCTATPFALIESPELYVMTYGGSDHISSDYNKNYGGVVEMLTEIRSTKIGSGARKVVAFQARTQTRSMMRGGEYFMAIKLYLKSLTIQIQLLRIKYILGFWLELFNQIKKGL